jgi:hypothetical protein
VLEAVDVPPVFVELPQQFRGQALDEGAAAASRAWVTISR